MLFPVFKSKIRYQDRHNHKLSYLVAHLDFIFSVSDIRDNCMNLSCISGINGWQLSHNSL